MKEKKEGKKDPAAMTFINERIGGSIPQTTTNLFHSLKAVCEDDEEQKGRRSKSPTKKIRPPLDFSSELLHAHPANATNFKEYEKILKILFPKRQNKEIQLNIVQNFVGKTVAKKIELAEGTAASAELPDSKASDYCKERKKLLSQETSLDWLKFDNNAKEEPAKQWKKDFSFSATNQRILSFHVAAFEKTVKGDASDSFGGKYKQGFKNYTCGSTKNEKRILTSTFVIQNPFKFPRQQSGESNIPEFSQFLHNVLSILAQKEKCGVSEEISNVPQQSKRITRSSAAAAAAAATTRTTTPGPSKTTTNTAMKKRKLHESGVHDVSNPGPSKRFQPTSPPTTTDQNHITANENDKYELYVALSEQLKAALFVYFKSELAFLFNAYGKNTVKCNTCKISVRYDKDKAEFLSSPAEGHTTATCQRAKDSVMLEQFKRCYLLKIGGGISSTENIEELIKNYEDEYEKEFGKLKSDERKDELKKMKQRIERILAKSPETDQLSQINSIFRSDGNKTEEAEATDSRNEISEDEAMDESMQHSMDALRHDDVHSTEMRSKNYFPTYYNYAPLVNLKISSKDLGGWKSKDA